MHSLGATQPALLPPDEGDISEADEKRALLQFYMSVFVPTISVASVPSSFYTSLYVPMAFQCSGVLDALIACSALHQARLSGEAARIARLQSISSKHQARCHAFLRDRISISGQPLKEPFEVTAVTLLLIGLEATKSTGSSIWLRQLQSVRGLLCHLNASEAMGYSAWELECLRRHYSYHDLMATVMEGIDTSCQGNISLSSLIDQRGSADDSDPDRTMTSDIDPLMGISTSLIGLIRQIRALESPVALTEFTSLERKLLQWKHSDQFSIASRDNLVALDLVALAEAYRLCGLILLYRKVDREHPMLYPLAVRILSVLQRIPEGSAVEAGFNLPLFLAGAELRDVNDIEACMRRLKSTHAKYRFDNISRIQVVLEHVWRCQPRQQWDSVLREKQWSLSLS